MISLKIVGKGGSEVTRRRLVGLWGETWGYGSQFCLRTSLNIL